MLQCAMCYTCTYPVTGYALDSERDRLRRKAWDGLGPGSSVSIATRYGLDGPGIESR